MFKPSDRPHGCHRSLAVALSLALVPFAALAGVSTLDPAPPTTAVAKPVPKAGGPFQIRCWQDGRLLFEENGVILPDTQYATLVAASDRHGHPVYVAETRNATCLIRPAVAERSAWPR